MTPADDVAWITGASSGIGRATALELVRRGWTVAATARRREELDALAVEALGGPGRILPFACDVTDSGAMAACVAAIEAAAGPVALAFLNAGVAPKVRMDLLETTEESFDHVLGINLKSTFFLSQAAARQMCQARAQNPQLTPKIINISSVSAYTSSTQRGEYCISKAAIAMVTQLFADRLADEGINVYEIRPGIIATDMTGPVKEKYDALIAGGITPIKRWGQPEDIASAVWAVCSGLLDFSTGEVINVDGGFHLRRL